MARATIVIEGNCGRDPEERTTKSGKKMCDFSVAVTERVREGDGWVDGSTTWYKVLVFDYQADNVLSGLKKGAPVVVGGRFSIDEWEGQDGALRTTPTILADWVGIKPRAPREQQQAASQKVQQKRKQLEDSVPF